MNDYLPPLPQRDGMTVGISPDMFKGIGNIDTSKVVKELIQQRSDAIEKWLYELGTTQDRKDYLATMGQEMCLVYEHPRTILENGVEQIKLVIREIGSQKIVSLISKLEVKTSMTNAHTRSVVQ